MLFVRVRRFWYKIIVTTMLHMLGVVPLFLTALLLWLRLAEGKGDGTSWFATLAPLHVYELAFSYAVVSPAHA